MSAALQSADAATPHDQLMLPLTQALAADGQYPSHPGSGGVAGSITMGMIMMCAGSPSYGMPAAGQSLQTNEYYTLYTVLGTSFGGSQDNFQLPNLNGIVAVGGGVAAPVGQTLPLNYIIAVSGFMPGQGGHVPFLGVLVPFAGSFVPDGWLAANGQALDTGKYDALFSLLGTSFGGSGSSFNLPNLNGAGVVGAGGTVAVGEQVPGTIPGLGINVIICIEGDFPTGGEPAFPSEQALGEVVAFAGSQIPEGWALCDGRSLPVTEYAALFKILGTTFGGDGYRDFSLPDARGQLIVGKA